MPSASNKVSGMYGSPKWDCRNAAPCSQEPTDTAYGSNPMTLHWRNRQAVFECNVCGDMLETGETEFDEALDAMRSEDWRAIMQDGVWEHRCAECG
jgi:hypothetical protein